MLDFVKCKCDHTTIENEGGGNLSRIKKLNQSNQITMQNLINQINIFIDPARLDGFNWFLKNKTIESAHFMLDREEFYLVLNGYSSYRLKNLAFADLVKIAEPKKIAIKSNERLLHKIFVYSFQEETWFEEGWGAL